MILCNILPAGDHRPAPSMSLGILLVPAVTPTVHIAEPWTSIGWVPLVLLEVFAKPGVGALTTKPSCNYESVFRKIKTTRL